MGPAIVPAIGGTPAVLELEAEYQAYRRRQARALLHLLPQEAIRPLYRSALGESSVAACDDPLALLVARCEVLLPLPPFEVWMRDYLEHPEAHLADLDASLEGPTPDAPSRLASRLFRRSGGEWVAELWAFRDGTGWRALIAFEDADGRSVARTSVIFRESTAAGLRARFSEFDAAALAAFLRSSLS